MLFRACLMAVTIGATPASGCTISFIISRCSRGRHHACLSALANCAATSSPGWSRFELSRLPRDLACGESDADASVDQSRRADRRWVGLDEVRLVEQILRAEERLHVAAQIARE